MIVGGAEEGKLFYIKRSRCHDPAITRRICGIFLEILFRADRRSRSQINKEERRVSCLDLHFFLGGGDERSKHKPTAPKMTRDEIKQNQ